MNRHSRREFIARTALASSATVLCGPRALPSFAAEAWPPPLVVFSKVYQQLKLDFDEAAALTAEVGIDGIDCPVRPGGEILPENVAGALPDYAAALKNRGLQLLLLTTAITSISSPYAEDIVRTAKKLDVQFYRLGFVMRKPDAPASQQVREVRAQLKDLATLNQKVGIGAVFQNHSPAGHSYLGGDLSDMYDLVKGFDPAQIGIAFDIGHALVVHGDDWRRHFEKLKSHIKVAYVKDVKQPRRWVPFGEGNIAATGYFTLLKQMGYRAPVCLHIEYDWKGGARAARRTALVKALRQSATTLRGWLMSA